MNRDTKLLGFSIEDNGLGEKITETTSFSDLRPTGFKDIATFIETRNYAKHKRHFQKWLVIWGIDTAAGFCDITHCLGINDTLWVKETDSSLMWDDVNLYKNEFSDVAQTTAFESGLYGLQLSSTDIMSPEFTSEGTCPKCWKRENNEIFLYKAGFTGASNVGLEPYSEYIASSIVEQMINDSITYDLSMFKKKLCSKCRLFTTEEYGYVPFYKFIDSSRKYTLSDILDICESFGFREECEKMLFTDSIVFNQDRHLGNFGFMVDNESFEIKSFAPLFDYNCSFLCNAMDTDLNNFEEYEKKFMLGHKLGGRFSDVGKALSNNRLISLIPGEIKIPVHEKYNLPSARLTKIMDIFENNLMIITKRKINYSLVPKH
ncbi:hypothetical protein SAMN06296386_104330 [Lachnospiraceae bacterium]|nr:hypothetical protein SAMN06296386_104330 [Lachnospiraceae bacterium]